MCVSFSVLQQQRWKKGKKNRDGKRWKGIEREKEIGQEKLYVNSSENIYFSVLRHQICAMHMYPMCLCVYVCVSVMTN